MLQLPSNFVNNAVKITKLLNTRSRILASDLSKLESDLGEKPTLATKKRSTAKPSTALHEGYSEDVQRQSEDIEEDAKDRIKSGEWSPETIQRDRDIGFLPKSLESFENQADATQLTAVETGTPSIQQSLKMISHEEHVDEERLKREYVLKRDALQRMFERRAAHLLEQDSARALPTAGARMASLPAELGVGSYERQPARTPMMADEEELASVPLHRRRAAPRHGAAPDPVGHLYQSWEQSPNEQMYRPKSWSQTLATAVGRLSGRVGHYRGDYSWPSHGQVQRGDEFDNRADCGLWGGNC